MAKTNEKLVELEKFMFNEVPSLIESEDQMDVEKYLREIRTPINTMVMEIAMGVELVDGGKKGPKFKLKRKTSEEDIIKLGLLLESYNEIEEKFFKSIVDEYDENEDDDLEIPPQTQGQISIRPIWTDEELKKLKIRDLISDFSEKIAVGTISAAQVMQLKMAGDVLRKKKALLTAAIVGGSVVVAGTATAIIVHQIKKKSEDNLDDLDATTVDIIDSEEIHDIDSNELVDLDIPEVEID